MNRNAVNPKASHWRLAVNGGLSWWTAKIPGDAFGEQEKYIKELKSGHLFGADGTYFFNDKYGLGFKFTTFRSDNSLSGYFQIDTSIVAGTVSDDLAINFFAPTLWIRYPSRTGMSAFMMGLSIGYVHYVDYGRLVIYDVKISGGSVGLAWDLNYDIGISEHWALGLGAAITMGTLSSIDITSGGSSIHQELPEGSYQGVGHVDLTIGLRLR
jgi:hypothetical protein